MRRREHHPWYIWRQTLGTESQDLLSRPISPRLLVPSITRSTHRFRPKPTRVFGSSSLSTTRPTHTTHAIHRDAPKTESPALSEPCSITDIPHPVSDTSIRSSECTPKCLCLIRTHCTPPLHSTRVTSSPVQGCPRPATNIHSPALLPHHCHVLTTHAAQCMLWHPTAHARLQILSHEH